MIKLIVTLLFSITTYGAPPSQTSCIPAIKNGLTKDPNNGLPPKRNGTFASAAEIEVDLDQRLFPLFTTTDGTISSLLRDSPPPPFLTIISRDKNLSSMKEIMWDDLTFNQQVELLNYATKEQKFFETRDIKGLKIKDTMEYEGFYPITFMGKEYENGDVIEIGKYLKPNVELRGPTDPGKISGFELHLSPQGQPFNPEDIVEGAWDLQEKVLGIPKTHLHLHNINKIPMDKLVKEPRLTALKITDLYRRINLLYEMNASMTHSNHIKVTFVQDGINWSNLGQDSLSSTFKHFHVIGRYGLEGTPEHRLKLGYTGIAGRGFYENGEDLWGLELRTISEYDDLDFTKKLVKSVDEKMASLDVGISDEQYKAWINKVNELLVPIALEDSYYSNLNWNKIQRNQSQRINTLIANDNFRETIQDLQSEKGYLEVIMLFQDYSRDPLFLNKPKAFFENIENLQFETLSRINNGETYNIGMIQNFLNKSGIYEAYLDSFQMQRQQRF